MRRSSESRDHFVSFLILEETLPGFSHSEWCWLWLHHWYLLLYWSMVLYYLTFKGFIMKVVKFCYAFKNFLNLFRFMIWERMWSILVNVPCTIAKVFSVVFGVMSYKCQLSHWVITFPSLLYTDCFFFIVSVTEKEHLNLQW